MALDLHHDPSPTGSDTIALPRGPRVTLRPVHPQDLDGLRALADKAGLLCEDLELRRLVRSDPTSRLVVCATAQVDGAEAIVGVGVIELAQHATMPSLLLVDAGLTDGLHRVLAEALIERARSLTDSRVA